MPSRKDIILFNKEALKDIKKLSPKLKNRLYKILTETIAINPYAGKKLMGDLTGFYSYILTYQDRIVYTIHDGKLVVMVYRAKTHYGE